MADVDVVQGKSILIRSADCFPLNWIKRSLIVRIVGEKRGISATSERIFLEEKSRTPVWENKGQTTDLRSPFLVKRDAT